MVRNRPSVAILSFLLTASAAAAHDVVLEIAPVSPAVRCEMTAVSVRTEANENRELPLSQRVFVAGASTSVRVTLPELPAEIAPIAKGCWAPRVHVPAGPAAAVTVEVWPTATVLGGIAFEKKSEEPQSIAGSFIDPSHDREDVGCELDAKLWRCTVPAGRPLQMQVAIDDFAPLFVWDLNLAPDAVYDSGIHTLVRGAAVTGRAMVDRGRPAANARVRIVPLTSGHQSPSDRAVKMRETRTNAGGHFQLAGLEPGVYRVISTVEGRSDAVIESLDLRAGEHLELGEPLFHAELAELMVLLTPPVSSAQTPWTVELLRAGEQDMTLVSVAKGAASVDGHWTRAGLQPTAYHLRVFGTGGSELVARDIVLRGGQEQIAVDISAIRVTGRILAGDEGVAAQLTFDKDRRRVTATSDEEGAFTAEFPVEGLWIPRVTMGRMKVRLGSVEIAASPESELILRMPGGGVQGKVLDQNGKTAADVIVGLKGAGSYSGTYSDEEGKFQILGVEAGAYSIEAEARDDLGAGPFAVAIAEDQIAEMDLRLESWKEVTGVVTTASGAAASGAVVRNFDPATGAVEDTYADARGGFSFRVKPRSTTIDLIVLSPPAPIAVRRIAVGERRVVSANVALAPAGTKLRVYIPRTPPWPSLTGADGVARSLGLFLMPLFERRLPRELVDGGFNFHLEPGPYRLCDYPDVPCRELQLGAHAETTVILTNPQPTNTSSP